MKACERVVVGWALQEADGNISTAARLLGLTRAKFRVLLNQLKKEGDE